MTKYKPRPYVKKGTLAERAAAMKQRHESAEAIDHWADPEVRRARIRLLKERMGLSTSELAMKLGNTLSFAKQILQGQRSCPMPTLLLVETIYRAFLQQQNRDHAKAVEASAQVEIDPALRAKVLATYLRTKSDEETARELALSPEVVQACIVRLK